MSLHHSDIVVIGSELTAVMTAAWHAHAGKRVTVLKPPARQEKQISLGGKCAPTTSELWHMPTSGPAAELFDKLGIRHDAKRIFGSAVPLGVVGDPDARFEMELDDEKLSSTLQRVYGDTAAPLRSELARIDPAISESVFREAAHLHESGFLARRRSHRRLVASGDGLRKSAACRGLAEAGFGPVIDAVAPFTHSASGQEGKALAQTLSGQALLTGAYSDGLGGMSVRETLANLCFRVIESHGGSLVDDVEVTQVASKRGRATEIATSATKKTFSGTVVIDGTIAQTISSTFADTKLAEKYRSRESAVEPSGGLSVVRWLAPRGSVPRGAFVKGRSGEATISHHIVVPDGGETAGALLTFCTGLMDDKKKRHKPLKNGLDEPVAIIIAQRTNNVTTASSVALLERKLDELCPFTRESVIARDAFWGSDAHALHPTYGGTPQSNDFGGRAPQTPLKNMFRAGRDLCPALGIHGEIAATMSCVALVSKALERAR